MIDKSAIIDKFQAIDHCLNRIGLAVQGDSSRIDIPDVQDIFVLNLLRAVQTILDVASMLLNKKIFLFLKHPVNTFLLLLRIIFWMKNLHKK